MHFKKHSRNNQWSRLHCMMNTSLTRTSALCLWWEFVRELNSVSVRWTTKPCCFSDDSSERRGLAAAFINSTESCVIGTTLLRCDVTYRVTVKKKKFLFIPQWIPVRYAGDEILMCCGTGSSYSLDFTFSRHFYTKPLTNGDNRSNQIQQKSNDMQAL